MKQYLDMVRHVLTTGNKRIDRTGTGTISVFGYEARYDLADGFPLCTTKKTSMRAITEELLWFLKGSTDNADLVKKNVHIWDEWALHDDLGSLGPIYGKQWRSWQGKAIASKGVNVSTNLVDDVETFTGISNAFEYIEIDQIKQLIENLKTKPFSRRHVITAWNPADLPDESKSPQQNVLDGKMALAPCHCLFQFYVQELSVHHRRHDYLLRGLRLDFSNPLNDEESHQLFDQHDIPKYKLSCRLDQRSMDVGLGAVYNVASYALLLMMVAQVTNMRCGEFIHHIGDMHIYLNHVDALKEQLTREPYRLPTMKINPNVKDIFNFTIDDFELVGYYAHPHIKMDVAV